jgi:hypothetical protein
MLIMFKIRKDVDSKLLLKYYEYISNIYNWIHLNPTSLILSPLRNNNFFCYVFNELILTISISWSMRFIC